MIARTPELSPETVTAVHRSVCVPSPSCPTRVLPQHFTAPVSNDADEWLLADAMARTPAARDTTVFDATHAEPVPALFVAATVKVYWVPFVRPTTVCIVCVDANGCGACAAFPTYGVIT